jgi:hypothetical protein
MSEEYRVCRVCGASKPLSDYYKWRDFYKKDCKTCFINSRKEYDKVKSKEADHNPDRHRGYLLKSKYGLTAEDYDKLADQQSGKCAICKEEQFGIHPKTGNKMPLVVDHCHSTNGVRGLLCSNCNRGLGMFKDNYLFLQNAISYLLNYENRHH